MLACTALHNMGTHWGFQNGEGENNFGQIVKCQTIVWDFKTKRRNPNISKYQENFKTEKNKNQCLLKTNKER